MSGISCDLHCKHCNHVYLHDMKEYVKAEQLLEMCRNIDNDGGIGILLSGGCNNKGEMLNLRTLLPTIQRIKDETNLIIKLHTGFVDEELAHDIVEAGIDIASMECIGANETIHEVLGLPVTVEKYAETFENLKNAGMPHIVPHVCIGLHYGKLLGEFKALEIIKETCDPSVLVFIVLKPTKGTAFAEVQPPAPEDVKKVISNAKKLFPKIELSLGCMRPRSRGREPIELAALNAGVTRMEIPSKQTIRVASERGYKIQEINACCALPEEFEERAIKK